MKIWHQSLTVLDDVSPYRSAIEHHMRSVARPGTEVVLHGMKPGTYRSRYPGQYVAYSYAQHFHTLQFLDAAVRAEREGYDAFIIATFPDIGLYEARSAVDIPVIGIGEASIHTACLLGDQFSIIGFVEPMLKRYEANVRRYGLRERMGPTFPVHVPFDDLLAAYEHPGRLVAHFEEVAQRALDAGSDVLIPADGPLNAVLRKAGVTRIGDAPVLDTFGSAIKLAEAMVDLRTLSGVYVNRRPGFFYARPPDDLVDEVRRYYGAGR